MRWRRREDQGITLVFFLLSRPLQFTKAAHTKFDFARSSLKFYYKPARIAAPAAPATQLIYVPAHTQLISSLCSCLIVARIAARLPTYMPAPSWERVLSMSGPISERADYAREKFLERILKKNFDMELQYGIKICQYFWRKIKNRVGTCNVPTQPKRNKRTIALLLL